MINDLLQHFIENNPYLLTFISVVGTLRLFIKPLMDVIRILVKETPTQADDKLLEKFDRSGFKKVMIWAADYLTSLNLQPRK